MILRWKFTFFLMLVVGCPFLVVAGITIKDVKVSIQAKSGIEARDLALKEARQKAYQQLAGSEQGRKYGLVAAPLPQAEALESAVDTFEVESEKISAQRYAATFSITFSETGLLNLGQITPAPAQSLGRVEEIAPSQSQQSIKADANFVILPLYITSDEALLWQPVNPFRAYVSEPQARESLKGIIPLGDLEDMAEVSIEDIMAGKHQKVRRLIERYQKDLALVLLLKQLDYEGQSHELTVKVFDKNSEQRVFEPIQIDAVDQKASFKAAVESALHMLVQPGAGSVIKGDAVAAVRTLPVQVSFENFAQWQHIKTALNNSAIQRFDIASLSRKNAEVVLYSQTPVPDLINILAQAGIHFLEASPGMYEMKIVGQNALTDQQDPLSPFALKQEPQ